MAHPHTGTYLSLGLMLLGSEISHPYPYPADPFLLTSHSPSSTPPLSPTCSASLPGLPIQSPQEALPCPLPLVPLLVPFSITLVPSWPCLIALPQGPSMVVRTPQLWDLVLPHGTIREAAMAEAAGSGKPPFIVLCLPSSLEGTSLGQ